MLDDLDFHFKGKKIQPCYLEDDKLDKTLLKLFNTRRDCEANSHPYHIAVYYVAGTFIDSKTTGCTNFHYDYFTDANGNITNEKFRFSIILTDSVTPMVFAHELGHALFQRRTGATTFTNEDPDDYKDPQDQKHNSNSCNLMFPTVTSTALTQKQIDTASLSMLLADNECSQVPAVPTFPPENSRKIEVEGMMHILDYENFGDSERCDPKKPNPPSPPFVLNLGPFNTHGVFPWIEKCGDEIRVDARFDFDLQMDLSVDVSYDIMFFEGTNANTTEMDKRIKTTTPIKIQKDAINKSIPVNIGNGSDYAWITLKVSNKQQ